MLTFNYSGFLQSWSNYRLTKVFSSLGKTYQMDTLIFKEQVIFDIFVMR